MSWLKGCPHFRGSFGNVAGTVDSVLIKMVSVATLFVAGGLFCSIRDSSLWWGRERSWLWQLGKYFMHSHHQYSHVMSHDQGQPTLKSHDPANQCITYRPWPSHDILAESHDIWSHKYMPDWLFWPQYLFTYLPTSLSLSLCFVLRLLATVHTNFV